MGWVAPDSGWGGGWAVLTQKRQAARSVFGWERVLTQRKNFPALSGGSPCPVVDTTAITSRSKLLSIFSQSFIATSELAPPASHISLWIRPAIASAFPWTFKASRQ